MGERYFVNVGSWAIEEDDLTELMTDIVQDRNERDKMMRFIFLEDRQRALVSYLLKRKLARDAIALERWLDRRLVAEDSDGGSADNTMFVSGPTPGHLTRVLELIGEFYKARSLISSTSASSLCHAGAVVDGESAVEEPTASSSSARPQVGSALESYTRCVEGAPFSEMIRIERTSWGKPFLGYPRLKHTNFNFNVSHEGAFVAAASDYFALVGVDVGAPKSARAQRTPTRKMNPTTSSAASSTKREDAPNGVASSTVELTTSMEDLEQLQRDFVGCLTAREWGLVQKATLSSDTMRQTADTETYNCFLRLWSLKESFVKARGDGLGFDLSKCEFHIDTDEEGPTWEKIRLSLACSVATADNGPLPINDEHLEGRKEFPPKDTGTVLRASASVKTGSKTSDSFLPQTDWKFRQSILMSGSQKHWISVAQGPLHTVQEDSKQDIAGKSIKSCFVHTSFTAEHWRKVLALSPPPFVELNVAELIESAIPAHM
ncbi:unnamed protein product [Amoebophrya sp. A25]|nr:unnamed protein product [Amoebophrya sp. A25]|eukprot:GSA25T00005969001.1